LLLEVKLSKETPAEEYQDSILRPALEQYERLDGDKGTARCILFVFMA
jgi:hypothetical protein